MSYALLFTVHILYAWGPILPGTHDRPGPDYYGICVDGLARATLGGNHYRRVHKQVKFT